MEVTLFSPLQIRDVVLKNRIVLAPMLTYSATDGMVTDWHLMHLGKFAAGGAGLVIMEATAVTPDGRSSSRDAGLWHDGLVSPLRRITNFIRSCGGVPGIQLNHSGRKVRASLPWDSAGDASLAWMNDTPVAPSAHPHAPGYPEPHEADAAEIEQLVEDWGRAAARADAAGFEVLEIHCAHGYLLHQFLSPTANRRTDRYGGSLVNRLRFPIEIVERVRENWPSNKPLMVRVSAVDYAGWHLEDTVEFARAVKGRGVDVIDCSSGGILTHAGEDIKPAYGYQVGLAAAVREQAGIKTMAVGLIIHADQADGIVRNGKADLAALGREFLHNPNWPIDAAQKLGLMPSSASVPRPYGHWLDKRAAGKLITPSTWRIGIESVQPAEKAEGHPRSTATTVEEA